MKRLYSFAAPAVLISLALAPAYGARKPKPDSAEAQLMLEDIISWSSSVANAADNLGQLAKTENDPRAQLEGLDVLREDVNRIGRELKTLEAERGSLAEWEGRALDQILPLMHDVADKTEKAIQTYNSDRRLLWTTSDVDDTAKIAQNADQVSEILRDYLKLAKAREKEIRLEHRLGEVSGS